MGSSHAVYVGVVAVIIGFVWGVGVVPIGCWPRCFMAWEELFDLIISLCLRWLPFFSIWLDEKHQTYKTSQTLLGEETLLGEKPRSKIAMICCFASSGY